MPNRVAANNIITDGSIVYCICITEERNNQHKQQRGKKKSDLSTINIESVRMYYYIKPPLPLDFNCVFPIFSNRIQKIAI